MDAFLIFLACMRRYFTQHLATSINYMPSSSWLKIGWWPLRVSAHVAKTGTFEGEKCAALHAQQIDHLEYTIQILLVHCLLYWSA